jgi:beta-lactamase superfamily II metal-dependent hydrolase
MGLWLRDRAFGRRIRGGSATAILETFRVAKLWIGREVSIPALARLEEFARERNIPIEHALRGKSFHWDGADGDFLWPEIEEAAPSPKNNDSLVLRMHYGYETLLLPGDAENRWNAKFYPRIT